jgi:hypothetical protein
VTARVAIGVGLLWVSESEWSRRQRESDESEVGGSSGAGCLRAGRHSGCTGLALRFRSVAAVVGGAFRCAADNT